MKRSNREFILFSMCYVGHAVDRTMILNDSLPVSLHLVRSWVYSYVSEGSAE